MKKIIIAAFFALSAQHAYAQNSEGCGYLHSEVAELGSFESYIFRNSDGTYYDKTKLQINSTARNGRIIFRYEDGSPRLFTTEIFKGKIPDFDSDAINGKKNAKLVFFIDKEGTWAVDINSYSISFNDVSTVIDNLSGKNELAIFPLINESAVGRLDFDIQDLPKSLESYESMLERGKVALSYSPCSSNKSQLGLSESVLIFQSDKYTRNDSKKHIVHTFCLSDSEIDELKRIGYITMNKYDSVTTGAFATIFGGNKTQRFAATSQCFEQFKRMVDGSKPGRFGEFEVVEELK